MKRIIRLCYKKVIDAGSIAPWDQLVFSSSFSELKMQVQFYDTERKHTSFRELLLEKPAADKLHFLVSTSVTGYLRQLNGQIPDLLDNAGNRFLLFTHYRFEIIDSDLTNLSSHKIAISFYTDPLIWHDTLSNYLLLSSNSEPDEDGVRTHLFQLVPFVTIYSLKEEKQ